MEGKEGKDRGRKKAYQETAEVVAPVVDACVRAYKKMNKVNGACACACARACVGLVCKRGFSVPAFVLI